MEITAVLIAIIVSTAYALSRFVRIIRAKNTPCDDCPGCALKNKKKENSENPCCCCKKTAKNFVM